jgi:hypothetical protein
VNEVVLTSTSKSEVLNGGRLESWKAVEAGGGPHVDVELSAERQPSNQRRGGL